MQKVREGSDMLKCSLIVIFLASQVNCKKRPLGEYSVTNEENCSPNCAPPREKSDHCDKLTGRCSEGCNRGWHGDRCNHQCSKNCLKRVCNAHNGTCLECEVNYSGDYCDNKDTQRGTYQNWLISVTVIVILIVIGGIILIAYIWIKRRQKALPHQNVEGQHSRESNRQTPPHLDEDKPLLSREKQESHPQTLRPPGKEKQVLSIEEEESGQQTLRSPGKEKQVLSIEEEESGQQTVTCEVVPPSNITLIEDKVKGIINEAKGDKPCPLHCVIYNPSCRIGDTNIVQKIEDLASKTPVLLIDTGTQRNPFPCFEEKFKNKVTVIYLQTTSGEVEKTNNNTKSTKAIRKLIKDLIDK